ncbi:MAG: Bacterial transcriptional activator domain protein [Chloroflexi bacterium ADurb.Bin360]|nr:MAG: Bacterial transcriptional activator domain protein [Chloroflexi bacterium ADurb.Bin360]
MEAYWGLTRAHGFHGVLDGAERAAAQGISLAEQAGDAWIGGLIRVSLGATYVLARKVDLAAEWLAQALNVFHECGDTYGQAITRLWQCLLWQDAEDTLRLTRGLELLLRLVREQHYEGLLTQQTLLGPRDPRRIIPLLLYAWGSDIERAFAGELLAHWGIAGGAFHPGFQLRVQTLGAFRVWRGLEEVSPQEWRRESARQLFQLLLGYRRQLLERDQILELLWPGQEPEIALRDFKVALSTAFKVLEPERKANAPSAFIVREGTLYGWRADADVILDVEQYEQAIASGDALWAREPDAALVQYRVALAFYQGDYLQEYPYAEWAAEERERLRGLYVRTAERLAQVLAERGAWAEVIEVCEALLLRDNFWEEAYRLLMTAQARLGNRPQVLRAYQRCVDALREELDVAPSEETVQVYATVNVD